MLCKEATLHQTEAGHWVVDGDPTEGALLTVGIKAGLNLDLERERVPRTDTIPFEAEHRFMATLRGDRDGRGYIYLKGAPEQVLGMCALAHAEGGDRPLDPAAWHRRIEELAQPGQRVLAVAAKAAGRRPSGADLRRRRSRVHAARPVRDHRPAAGGGDRGDRLLPLRLHPH